MYYYYKIENKINNQKYIGITTNPQVRKNRHFNKLRKNCHFNPHLQCAFNKYGEDNFFFEIIEECDFADIKDAYKYEAKLIEKYDTFNNGYNCNPGGEWTGKKGRFSKEEVFYIKSAFYFNKQAGGTIARYYNCPHATTYSVAVGRTYKPWGDEFDNLPEEEKRQIYEDFCAISNFEILNIKTKKYIRKLNKEQVFTILLNDENKFTTFAKLRNEFGIKGDHRYTFQEIRTGKTYQDYFIEFSKLSQEEKNNMLCTYKEIYK